MAENDEVTKDFNSCKRLRSTQMAQMTKLYTELEKQMISRTNVDQVKCLFEKLCDKFELFKTAHLECLDACSDSGIIDSLEVTYRSCQNNFIEFRERFVQWIAADDQRPEDDDARSVTSRMSSTSSKSRSKRLAAELRIKKLKAKYELEKAKRELELKEQLLEAECELEEAALEDSDEDVLTTTNPATGYPRSGVFEVNVCDGPASVPLAVRTCAKDLSVCANGTSQAAKTSTSGDPGQRDHLQINNSAQAVTQAVTTPSDVSGKVSTQNIECAFNRLATTLQEGFNLPKPEILSFSGKAIDYCKFVKNFETNVECKVSDDRLRLSYLIQYCLGEAKHCIEDCVLLEPTEGYRRAREILQTRYGKPHVISRSCIDKLVNGPQIKASDVDGLSRLALDMQKCEITLSQLGFASDIDSTDNLRRIVRRMPMHMRTRWVDVAYDINVRSDREPKFSDLVRFVDKMSHLAGSMYAVDLVKDNSQRNVSDHVSYVRPDSYVKTKVTTLATNTSSAVHHYPSCYCCSGTCQNLASCQQFSSMGLTERDAFVQKFKLCCNCLKGKHTVDSCWKQNLCNIPHCVGKHHTLLHSLVKPDSEHTVTQPSVNCAATSGLYSKSYLGIIPVTVTSKNGNLCHTYALLDNGADKTLCDKRLLQMMEQPGKPVSFEILTVNSTGSVVMGTEVDLRVQPFAGGDEVVLKKVWSVDKLPVSRQSAVTPASIRHIPHLADIDVPCIDGCEVLLLIGTDAPDAHIPLEVRSGDSSQPYAIRTRIGWAVRGPVPGENKATQNDVTSGSMQKFDRVTSREKAINIDVHSSKTRRAARGGLRRCFGTCTAESIIHARTKKMSPMQEPVLQEPKIQRKQNAKRKRKSSSFDPHPQTSTIKKVCYTGSKPDTGSRPDTGSKPMRHTANTQSRPPGRRSTRRKKYVVPPVHEVQFPQEPLLAHM